ncbi:MAG: hypothetical protein ACE5IF_00640 [Candidatus Bathyarchaeia archaeon]
MCRMLGIISRKPVPSIYLKDFRVLAEKGKVPKGAKEPGHKDGWGIVHYDDQIPRYLGRGPTNAMEDERYGRALRIWISCRFPGSCWRILGNAPWVQRHWIIRRLSCARTGVSHTTAPFGISFLKLKERGKI